MGRHFVALLALVCTDAFLLPHSTYRLSASATRRIIWANSGEEDPEFAEHRGAQEIGDAGEGGGLGDITGGLETTIDYLPNFTPLERIAITATGNLQRIIASYYNSPVKVRELRRPYLTFDHYCMVYQHHKYKPQ